MAFARVPASSAVASTDLTNGGATLAAQQDEAKPQQDEAKPRQDDAKPPKPAKAEKQEMPAKQKADKDQQKRNDKDPKRDAKQDRREDRQQAGNHGRIPDDKFRASFGQTHRFSVRTVVTTTRVIPNQTRFAYSGYSFVVVDPWPTGWALTDDCYIDFVDGGYYIVNVAHPGVRVALTIVG
jgi:hypothetical protein